MLRYEIMSPRDALVALGDRVGTGNNDTVAHAAPSRRTIDELYASQIAGETNPARLAELAEARDSLIPQRRMLSGGDIHYLLPEIRPSFIKEIIGLGFTVAEQYTNAAFNTARAAIDIFNPGSKAK